MNATSTTVEVWSSHEFCVDVIQFQYTARFCPSRNFHSSTLQNHSGEINEFWLISVALLGLIGMQAVYWLWIHPVNQFWLEEETLNKAGSRFFSFGLNQEQRSGEPWMNLRNQWEYAHVVRAGFALISLIAMMIALSMH